MKRTRPISGKSILVQEHSLCEGFGHFFFSRLLARMGPRTRWVVAAVSHGPTPTIRGVAAPRQLGPQQPQQPPPRGKGLDKVRSFEASLGALGAEDIAAKTEVEAALKRARELQKVAAQPTPASLVDPRRSSGTMPAPKRNVRGSVECSGRHARSRGRVVSGRTEEGSTCSPGAAFCHPNVRMQKVRRAFRASFGEDRGRTRGRGGTARGGTQSLDTLRGPGRGVAARCHHEHKQRVWAGFVSGQSLQLQRSSATTL